MSAIPTNPITLAGRRALVLGLGATGLSMARWLDRSGATIRVADTRDAPPALDALRASVPGADVRTGRFEDALLEGVDIVAVSPGVPVAEPVVRRADSEGLPVVGDIELFAQALPQHGRPKVVGITGTNGKSTVTALTGAMLRGAGVDCEVAGNIGPSVLDALMKRRDAGSEPEAWVLELSSFQLETTYSLGADAATVLNVSEDHLDRYAGIEDYAKAKARIFQGHGVQVLNRGDPRSRAMALDGRDVLTFGLDTPASREDFGLVRVAGDYWLARGTTPLVALRDLQLAGLHNAANALAALALVKACGLGLVCLDVLPALKAFRGLPHRVERVADVDGIAFLDDSKGTNVGSTVAALSGLARQLNGSGGRVVLIAGGEGKGQDFRPLGAAVGEAAREVVLIGRDADLIAAAVEPSGVPVSRAATMEEAVRNAFAAAHAGDIVLLSPACASFDMFDNYRHRGEVFTAAVKALGNDRQS